MQPPGGAGFVAVIDCNARARAALGCYRLPSRLIAQNGSKFGGGACGGPGARVAGAPNALGQAPPPPAQLIDPHLRVQKPLASLSIAERVLAAALAAPPPLRRLRQPQDGDQMRRAAAPARAPPRP